MATSVNHILKIIYQICVCLFEKAIYVYDCCVVNDILYTSYLCKILMLLLLIVCLLTNITTLIIVIWCVAWLDWIKK